MLAEELGQNIQTVRLKAGMSVNKLSEEAYVARASISKYESGKTLPGLAILADIHKALNIPLWELLPAGGVRKMKKMIKAASVAGYILGVLCMDGAVDTGLKICGACVAIFLFCLYHDWVERERERKRRWIGFQRKG